MAETFNCPACGAPLETDGKETSIQCEYCGETVIVPVNLRAGTAPVSGAVQFTPPPDQPSQAGNTTGRMDPSQVRQMMMSIRGGQIEDAARIFQAGTGVSEAVAQETIGTIANHITTSNRIQPAQLAAMMMGAFAQSAGGYNQPYQPAAPVQPRRRRSGIGCLLTLVVIILALYLGYTSISPKLLVTSLLSGSKNDPVRQTAVAPIFKIETAIATAINSNQSGGVGPSGSVAPVIIFSQKGSGQGGIVQTGGGIMGNPGNMVEPQPANH